MMFPPGLSVLGRSEIRIRQKAKSVSPMQKYEKTLNAKTFRAHFSLFVYTSGYRTVRRGGLRDDPWADGLRDGP